jgi:hypothetical protein
MMETTNNDRTKPNLDEELWMSLDVAAKSLYKMRSITAWWDAWGERKKNLSMDEVFHFSKKKFPRESESIFIVVNIIVQLNSFEEIDSITCNPISCFLCNLNHFARNF